jgi:hypothetical protein
LAPVVVNRSRQRLTDASYDVVISGTEMPCRSRHSLLALLTALVALGCGQSSQAADGEQPAAGNASLPSNAAPLQKPISWDAQGVIDGRFGIEGNWYAYHDSPTTDQGEPEMPAREHTLPDPELVGPDPDREPGWSTSPTQICMKGIATKVTVGSDIDAAFKAQYGAGVGFTLNNGSAYDAKVRGIVGFMFDVGGGSAEAPTPPTLRASIELPSVDVGTSYFMDLLVPAVDQALLFSEVDQGSWVGEPKLFTADALQAVTIQITTNTQAPKPYDFCVSNLRVLMEP